MKNQKGITIVSLIVTIIVMIILAGIALLFTVGEEGVINRSNQAVEKTTLAQIKEKAELVKASVDLEIKAKNTDNIIFTQEFVKRLAKELDGRIDGNRVIVNNDKYAITLDGTSLEVDVSEYNKAMVNISTLLIPKYEISENQIKISITTMESSKVTEYIEDIMKNATMAEKEKCVVEYYRTLDNTEKHEGVNTLDDIIVISLKSEFPEITHDTLDGWVNDPEVQTYANKYMQSILKGEKLKKDHFYLYAFGSTKEEVIDTGYEGYLLYCVLQPIAEASNNSIIEIKKDNKIIVEDSKFDTSAGYIIDNVTKGVYEISIKANSDSIVLVNEKIAITNLK